MKHLIDFLKAQKKSASVCVLVARTEVKTSHPEYKKIKKIAKVQGLINWIYENAVNNQRSREGKEMDFESLPRKWGTRNSPFIEHKGKLYIELKVEKTLEYHYELEGVRLDTALIEECLPIKKTRQDLDKEIILRDYALDNILEITCYGETFKREQR